MGNQSIESLEVEIYEWPSRFLVESEGPDTEYKRFYPDLHDFDPCIPHFVDLDECEAGWCSCRDFAIHIWPYLEDSAPHRTECIHILAARRYRYLFNQEPQKIKTQLNL